MKKFFASVPIVSYRSVRKIKDHKVRAKLYLLKKINVAEGVEVISIRFVRAKKLLIHSISY